MVQEPPPGDGPAGPGDALEDAAPGGAEGLALGLGAAARRGAWWALGGAGGAAVSLSTGEVLAALVPSAAWVHGGAERAALLLGAACAAFGAGALPARTSPERGELAEATGAAVVWLTSFAAAWLFRAVLAGTAPVAALRALALQLQGGLSLDEVPLLFASLFAAIGLVGARAASARGAPLPRVLATSWLLAVLGLALLLGSAVARTVHLVPLGVTVLLAGPAMTACALLAERRLRPWARARLLEARG